MRKIIPIIIVLLFASGTFAYSNTLTTFTGSASAENLSFSGYSDIVKNFTLPVNSYTTLFNITLKPYELHNIVQDKEDSYSYIGSPLNPGNAFDEDAGTYSSIWGCELYENISIPDTPINISLRYKVNMQGGSPASYYWNYSSGLKAARIKNKGASQDIGSDGIIKIKKLPIKN